MQQIINLHIVEINVRKENKSIDYYIRMLWNSYLFSVPPCSTRSNNFYCVRLPEPFGTLLNK